MCGIVTVTDGGVGECMDPEGNGANPGGNRANPGEGDGGGPAHLVRCKKEVDQQQWRSRDSHRAARKTGR